MPPTDRYRLFAKLVYPRRAAKRASLEKCCCADNGLVSRQSRQRLDSTQMLGRVARMSLLDCVRESLRLALKELEGALPPAARPVFWVGLWERYVESQTDYRAGSETLARKLAGEGVRP